MTFAPEGPARTLTLADRCDRCGAQAFVAAAVMARTGDLVDLMFCGHHFAKHEEAIREEAVDVTDARHLINNQPSPSASSRS